MKALASLPKREDMTLAELRKMLSVGQRKIVDHVIKHLERELIDALPELNDGVQTSAAQGSFSATLSIKKAKKGRFSGTLASRVRTPREPIEIDLHIDDSGQLSFGNPAGWDTAPGSEGEE